MKQSIKIKAGGKEILLTLQPDGNYRDDKGTIYPGLLFDKDFCGLYPFETGKWDPFWEKSCKPHDIAFERLKHGYQNPEDSNLKVFTDFTGSALETMAQGAYAVSMGIPYIVIGGLLGMVRWLQLEDKN